MHLAQLTLYHIVTVHCSFISQSLCACRVQKPHRSHTRRDTQYTFQVFYYSCICCVLREYTLMEMEDIFTTEKYVKMFILAQK